jgi:hypothetical protein
MTSLFLLALPRSLSSLCYQTARKALGLAEPTWTSDGEILNIDRMAAGRGFAEGAKFTTPDNHPALFRQLVDFLEQIVVADGFAYKDVVQPFVVAAWPGLGNFRVLKIRREVADVAYAMLEKGWFFPGVAACADYRDAMTWGDYEAAVIEGLLRAEETLRRVPGGTVDYEDLIKDDTVLPAALAALYPDRVLTPVPYIDANFLCLRREQLLRRKTELFRQLQAKVERVRSALQRREQAGAETAGALPAAIFQEAYQSLGDRIRRVVCWHVPRDATVLVVTKGDESLLNLEGRRAWHFPRRECGTHASLSPAAGSADLIAHLEELRPLGAGFLLLPRPAFWWLEHFQEFRAHLDNRYHCVGVDSACRLYRL